MMEDVVVEEEEEEEKEEAEGGIAEGARGGLKGLDLSGWAKLLSLRFRSCA
jgi:hypothetical protein